MLKSEQENRSGISCVLVLMLICVGSAHASWSYSTDFESGTLGDLDGQDGWTATVPLDGYYGRVVDEATAGGTTGNGDQWVEVVSYPYQSVVMERIVAPDENLFTASFRFDPLDNGNAGAWGTSRFQLYDDAGNNYFDAWYRTNENLYLLTDAAHYWDNTLINVGMQPFHVTIEIDYALSQQRITINPEVTGVTQTSNWYGLAFGETPTIADAEGGKFVISAQYAGIDDISLGYIPPDLMIVDPMQISAFENPLSGSTTAEYSVVLAEIPTADVTISFASSDPNVAVPADIVFHPQDWDDPQTVTVTVSNGVSASVSKLVEITNLAASSDGRFDEEVHVVELTVYNDDVPYVMIDTADGVAVDEQGETSDSYTVQLLSPLTEAMTVTLSTGDPTQIDLVGAPLEFSVAAWYERKTIDVAANDDGTLEDNPHQVVISHTAAGDAAYAGMTIDDVTVVIGENECGAWGYDAMDFDLSCDVNLLDLAAFSASWMNCTQPYGTGCVDGR